MFAYGGCTDAGRKEFPGAVLIEKEALTVFTYGGCTDAGRKEFSGRRASLDLLVLLYQDKRT